MIWYFDWKRDKKIKVRKAVVFCFIFFSFSFPFFSLFPFILFLFCSFSLFVFFSLSFLFLFYLCPLFLPPPSFIDVLVNSVCVLPAVMGVSCGFLLVTYPRCHLKLMSSSWEAAEIRVRISSALNLCLPLLHARKHLNKWNSYPPSFIISIVRNWLFSLMSSRNTSVLVSIINPMNLYSLRSSNDHMPLMSRSGCYGSSMPSMPCRYISTRLPRWRCVIIVVRLYEDEWLAVLHFSEFAAIF